MKRFILLCVLLFAGCELTDANKTDLSDENAQRLAYDGEGIVFGQSIEGIPLGADSSSVTQKLGKPSEVVRGAFPSVTYRYEKGLARTEFTVATDTSLGLRQGVISACVYPPYGGETREGVGIGTPRSKVEDVLGETRRGGSTVGYYDMDGRYVQIKYRKKQTVRTICMASSKLSALNTKGSVVNTSTLPSEPAAYAIDEDEGPLVKFDNLPEGFKKEGLRVVYTGVSNFKPGPTDNGIIADPWPLPLGLVNIEKQK